MMNLGASQSFLMTMAKRAEPYLLLARSVAVFMISLIAVWCPLKHDKTVAPRRVLGAVMAVGSCGISPRLMVDRIGVCNFVSKMGGAVRMLIMCSCN